MYTYSSAPFTRVIEDIDRACDWLRDLGIAFPQTRIGRYRDLFARLATYQRNGDLAAALGEILQSDYINAGFEINKILFIHKRLSERSCVGINTRLKSAVRGHELYVLDNENRSGRDFTFELTVAAMFGPSADRVDFSQDADVIVSIEGFPLFVECKRLKSLKKVQTRIIDGLGQLERRYASAESPWAARGVLALSVDRIANPKFECLPARSAEEVSAGMQERIGGFFDRYSAYWRTRVRPRTIGVIVSLEMPATVGVDGRAGYTTASEISVDALRPVWSPEFEWLRVLKLGIEQQ